MEEVEEKKLSSGQVTVNQLTVGAETKLSGSRLSFK
jgi:hypothetical protein